MTVRAGAQVPLAPVPDLTMHHLLIRSHLCPISRIIPGVMEPIPHKPDHPPDTEDVHKKELRQKIINVQRDSALSPAEKAKAIQVRTASVERPSHAPSTASNH